MIPALARTTVRGWGSKKVVMDKEVREVKGWGSKKVVMDKEVREVRG